ncbi:MAG TPA: ABC transporter permease [Bacteroidales bacterium]|nr:ABC transporter permease [Bacteroidales bacterium]
MNNYLKITLRNIRRQKFYAFINIAGLTIGLAASLLIILYILDELSYDSFHRNAGRIYRVNLLGRMSGQEFNSPSTSAPVAAGFMNEVPGVEEACRIALRKDMPVEVDDEQFTEKNVLVADSNFFGFFSFKLLAGDPVNVLSGPGNLVLTETAANKLFGYSGPGDNRCLGQSLESGTEKRLFTITGICEDPPANSHFHFSMILPMGSWDYSRSSSWMTNSLLTYIRLGADTDPGMLNSGLRELVKKHIGPQAQKYLGISFDEFLEKGGAYGFYLQPLRKIHLESNPDLHLEPGGNIKTIYLLAGIVIFIIVIACINFMNLSTAKTSGRAKEVGVRKALGSTTLSLRSQFFTESVVYALVSLLLAQVILILILPGFNILSGKLLNISSLLNLYYISSIVCLVVITGIIAGSYPAIYLTSFKPAETLRGKLKAGIKSKGIRRILVTFQFIMSTGLIICTLLMNKQLQFIRNIDTGFDKNNLVVIKNASSLGTNKNAFKEELLKMPGVESASICDVVPPEVSHSALFKPVGDDIQQRGSNYCIADEDLLSTFKLTLVNGRFFSKEFSSDAEGVVINEAAARLFGFENPVGEKIQTFWNDNKPDRHEIIGVVKDYNFQTLEERISSLLIFRGKEGDNIVARLKPGDISSKINLIKTKWKSFPESGSFSYSFIADDFNSKFRKQQQLGSIFLIFTVLAIVIASMGLLGLVSFTAEQRSREIGLRKAMGASSASIINLLMTEYLNIILISFFVAALLSYITIHWWLNNFAYKTGIGLLSFLTGGAISVLITVFSTGYQIIKAASRNPVDSLKYE